MGKIIREEWQCDRCGAIEPKRPSTGMGEVSLKYRDDGPVASNGSAEWSEVCVKCSDTIRTAMKALTPRPVHRDG